MIEINKMEVLSTVHGDNLDQIILYGYKLALSTYLDLQKANLNEKEMDLEPIMMKMMKVVDDVLTELNAQDDLMSVSNVFII